MNQSSRWNGWGKACLAAWLLVSGSSVLAQESAETKPADQVPATAPAEMTTEERDAWRAGIAGANVAAFAALVPSELKLRLVPLPVEELAARGEEAMAGLRKLSEQLADALIEHTRMEKAESVDDQELARINERIDRLRKFRADLVTRCNIVLTAWEGKGGDVTTQRAYVAMVEALEPEPTASDQVQSEPELTDEERQQKELAARVAAAVAKVREMPPVHERPEPWTIPVSELELELQPLRKEQIEERVQKWLEILQRNVRQRIRMDIAVSSVTDDAERQALADWSTQQQEVINAIVERARVAMQLLQKRGGDVREYQDYVAAATGRKLNLTDPAVLMAQLKAWLRSPSGGIKIGINLIKFVAVVIVFWVVSRIIGAIVSAAARRVPNTSTLLHSFLSRMTRKIIMIIGIVVGLSVLEINISPLVAALAGAGLVIGLALQGTLSNFASGILILISRPYDVGDVISAGGVFGKVDAMNLVSTRILTFDNQVMLVPNNQIWGGVITNVTALDTRRVDLVFGISYTDDMAHAQQVIAQVISEHPKVLRDPAPTIKVNELGDNSVNLIARPWVNTADYWDVYWDLMQQVKDRFDKEGISIPFPQRDFHLDRPIEVVMKSNSRRGQPAHSAPALQGTAPLGDAGGEPGPAGDPED